MSAWPGPFESRGSLASVTACPPEMDNDVTVQIEPAAAAGTKETRVFVTEKGYEPDKLAVRAVRPRELRSFGLRRRRAGLRWCFRPSTSGVPCRSTSQS
jgi:hypothetical protein